MCVESFKYNCVVAFKPEEYRNREVLQPPFSELFALKAGMNRTSQRLCGDKPNTGFDLIDEFQSNSRSCPGTVTDCKFKELAFKK